MPKVTPATLVTRLTSSSAASRDAPTTSASPDGERARRKSSAAASRSAPKADSTSWITPTSRRVSGLRPSATGRRSPRFDTPGRLRTVARGPIVAVREGHPRRPERSGGGARDEAEHGPDPHHPRRKPCRGPPICSRWSQARSGGPPCRRAASTPRDWARPSRRSCRKQVDAGIDVVDDGEMSKPGFIHYVNERLAGFEPSPDAPPGSTWARSREVQAFPDFYEWFGRVLPSPASTARHLACTGPIAYKGHAILRADLERLRRRAPRREPRRGVRAGDLALERRGVAPKPVLQDRRGVPVRHRRRHARGVSRHRRRGLPPADRRPAPGDPLDPRTPRSPWPSAARGATRASRR